LWTVQQTAEVLRQGQVRADGELEVAARGAVLPAEEGTPDLAANVAEAQGAHVTLLLLLQPTSPSHLRQTQVGMAGQAERACSELAYGDVKRIELAMALANEPKLLLMDEPTAGMAPEERHALMALTKRLVVEHNIAVLFTEHSMDVVFAFADRVIVLARGRLIAEGTPAQVRSDPLVQEVYFGSGTTFSVQSGSHV
jgi:ABC-type uncharacterized transport system ATPase subunit